MQSREMTEMALASWTEGVRTSALQTMLAGKKPDISFALGLPAPDLFPAGDIRKAADQVLSGDTSALQYGPVAYELKEQIAEIMAWRGVKVDPKRIFLTTGAQQGLSLCARLLLNPGGVLLAEDLSYTGFQQAVSTLSPRIVTVRANRESGIDVEEVHQVLSSGLRPAFIYAMSEGHNPMGTRMARENRIRLASLASEFSIPVVEDDAYGFLQYDAAEIPPLHDFQPDWVFYVGSFSKILSPALRVGWVVAPEQVLSKLAILKESSDIDTSTFSQKVLCAYLRSNKLKDHVHLLRSEYRNRRDVMVQAVSENFPKHAKYRSPASGIFLWVEMPEAVDTTDLLRVSLDEEAIAFLPGAPFAIGHVPGASHSMRLNFSHSPVEDILRGISRLGSLARRLQP